MTDSLKPKHDISDIYNTHAHLAQINLEAAHYTAQHSKAKHWPLA